MGGDYRVFFPLRYYREEPKCKKFGGAIKIRVWIASERDVWIVVAMFGRKTFAYSGTKKTESINQIRD